MLSSLLERIREPDPGPGRQARQRLEALTKPPGSLGRLEELAEQLCLIAGACPPPPGRAVVFTLAGDHGVVAEGVSAYPQVVTAQMVENFLAGGAAVNVLARHAGAEVVVADLGVATPLAPRPGLVARRVAPGTRNMARGPAMSREEALGALAAGAELVEAERRRGLELVATGEMGIGNSTAASALSAALLGLPAGAVTGPGTGLGAEGMARKAAVVARALEVNRPDPADPVGVLAALGGLEIAGLVGVILGGAAARRPVILDGFIAGAAALVAARLAPAVRPYLVAAHRSPEPGHGPVLAALGLRPYLDLGLRLGEGTGAALGISLARAAVAVLSGMATFKSAGVSGPTGGSAP
jgi:nicotinate-nucleotide--dimethylbenzimidazole phosphoribosyltransferase